MYKIVYFSLIFFVSVMVKAELSPEPIPNINSLPAEYPNSWVFAHDANFDALIAGRVIVLDVATDSHEYKGAIDAAQFASFIESKTRSELYVAETFYSRGTRGERTDVLTIYDKSNLQPIAEVSLPGGKRGQVVTNKYSLQLIDNDNYLLLFNFTPAASVLVIDIQTRTILNEIQTPGCSLIYPTGSRGFSSLCGDGSLITFQLTEDGKITKQKRVPAFFDVDADPLFDKPAFIGLMAYFPSFLGKLQAIDFSKNTPELGEPWSLVGSDEQKQNWRPGGWQIASGHANGKLYVLMQKDGHQGSHKNGGSEVWVFDVKTHKRLHRIELKNPGFSIEITGGEQPYLVVTNLDMAIDVYSDKGQWIRMIGGAGAMPITLHAKR